MSKFLPLFLRCTVREIFPRRNVWRQKGHICLSCHFVNKRVPLCRVIVCPGLRSLSFILRPSLSSTSRPPFTITSYCWTSIRVLHKQMIEQDRARKEIIDYWKLDVFNRKRDWLKIPYRLLNAPSARHSGKMSAHAWNAWDKFTREKEWEWQNFHSNTIAGIWRHF